MGAESPAASTPGMVAAYMRLLRELPTGVTPGTPEEKAAMERSARDHWYGDGPEQSDKP